MCHSRCPHENRNGECTVGGKRFPSDGHCADEFETDEEREERFIEEKEEKARGEADRFYNEIKERRLNADTKGSN